MSSVQTPNAAKEHLLHQDDSSSGAGIAKSRLESDDQVATGATQEQQLRRYWVRPLVAISIPAIVTAYYGVGWIYFVQGIANDEVIKYRTFRGSLFFYSWFIIGVFALSWSKYGLVGIEASMLRSRYWAAPNLVSLLMHSNSTWSSFSGWITAAIWVALKLGAFLTDSIDRLSNRFAFTRAVWAALKATLKSVARLMPRKTQSSLSRRLRAIKRREFHRLWCLLAFLSVLPFIAIPLSGLVFELSDGYIGISDAPSVQGRNRTTFNERYDDRNYMISNPPQHAWLLGSAPTIPGLGVIYTNGSLDRSEHSDFKKLPNVLPQSESIPDLFLAPQSDKPVSGRAWGLRIKYDCSIVRSASQFTILGEKPASAELQECGILPDYHRQSPETNCFSLQTPSGNVIKLRNSTINERFNVEAYFEVGTSGVLDSGKYIGVFPDFEAEEGNTSVVLEYAAWQYRTTRVGAGDDYDDRPLPFNATVEPFIEGMGSPFIKSDNNTYTVNSTFFAPEDASELVATYKTQDDGFWVIDVAPPIGVRCVASSGLGTAELDGVTSTFRNFQRSDPSVDPVYKYGSQRFGYTAQAILADGQFYPHYVAGGLTGNRPNSNTNRYSQFVDALSLLRSVNLAYNLDAFDLLYGVTSGFKTEWPESGLKSSREDKILTAATLIPGPAMGYIVLALLCLWAVLSASLGLWYGFRKRPSDRLDGYAMLRKGADMADELKGNEDFMTGKPFHDSRTLTGLRGS